MQNFFAGSLRNHSCLILAIQYLFRPCLRTFKGLFFGFDAFESLIEERVSSAREQFSRLDLFENAVKRLRKCLKQKTIMSNKIVRGEQLDEDIVHKFREMDCRSVIVDGKTYAEACMKSSKHFEAYHVLEELLIVYKALFRREVSGDVKEIEGLCMKDLVRLQVLCLQELGRSAESLRCKYNFNAFYPYFKKVDPQVLLLSS